MSHDIEQEHIDHNVDQQAGYYQGSDWSLPYMSPWSRVHADPALVSVLRHMNCSYLGQPGAPPTLLGLKQHARSLAKLIMLLEPSVNSGEVNDDNHNDGADGDGDGDGNDARRKLGAGGAFDWLADLGAPYTNDDPNHHRPLNALLNEVRGRHAVAGTAYHCPLAEVPPRQPGEGARRNEYYAAAVATKPFASHHNLVMHANEILERLDHEFSATGGLLSLVPPDDNNHHDDNSDDDNNQQEPSAELVALKNSLLGQFLVFCQGLVVRTHELQIEHARLLDVMAGEAVAPAQALSRAGPDGRTGRAVVFPQDRWVLANAGDDVFAALHARFDRQEALLQQKMRAYREAGTSGRADWELHRGGREYARGIVPVHVLTRYYRLAGKGGQSTIFVVPAAAEHPGLEATRDVVEAAPTVVSVVAPRWPERVSAWEARYQARITAATAAEREAWGLRREQGDRAREVRGLRLEVERQARIAEAATEMLAAVRAQGGEGGEEQKAELERQLRDQQANWEAKGARRRERRQARDAERYLQALLRAQRMANPDGELARYLGQVLQGGADGAGSGAGSGFVGGDDGMDLS